MTLFASLTYGVPPGAKLPGCLSSFASLTYGVPPGPELPGGAHGGARS